MRSFSIEYKMQVEGQRCNKLESIITPFTDVAFRKYQAFMMNIK